MDYGTFKARQDLLFFGAAVAFGFRQLASLRRSRGKPGAKGSERDGAGERPISPSTAPVSGRAREAEGRGR
jgi:hypothetical protein